MFQIGAHSYHPTTVEIAADNKTLQVEGTDVLIISEETHQKLFADVTPGEITCCLEDLHKSPNDRERADDGEGEVWDTVTYTSPNNGCWKWTYPPRLRLASTSAAELENNWPHSPRP